MEESTFYYTQTNTNINLQHIIKSVNKSLQTPPFHSACVTILQNELAIATIYTRKHNLRNAKHQQMQMFFICIYFITSLYGGDKVPALLFRYGINLINNISIVRSIEHWPTYNGVMSCSAVVWLTLDPILRSRATISKCPLAQAACNGDHWRSSQSRKSALYWISCSTTCSTAHSASLQWHHNTSNSNQFFVRSKLNSLRKIVFYISCTIVFFALAQCFYAKY